MARHNLLDSFHSPSGRNDSNPQPRHTQKVGSPSHESAPNSGISNWHRGMSPNDRVRCRQMKPSIVVQKMKRSPTTTSKTRRPNKLLKIYYGFDVCHCNAKGDDEIAQSNPLQGEDGEDDYFNEDDLTNFNDLEDLGSDLGAENLVDHEFEHYENLGTNEDLDYSANQSGEENEEDLGEYDNSWEAAEHVKDCDNIKIASKVPACLKNGHVYVERPKNEDIQNAYRLKNSDHTKATSKSPASSKKGYAYVEEDDGDEQDTSAFIIPEEKYANEAARRRPILDLEDEQFRRGITTEELSAAGWDRDHITLVQTIATRGFEPLLPERFKIDLLYIPDLLFSKEDLTIIGSARKNGEHNRARRALIKLFEIGPRVRDLLHAQCQRTPETKARQHLKQYIKWANWDSNLDPTAIIPLIALESKPLEIDADILISNIHRKMAKLHARYSTVLTVEPSLDCTLSSASNEASHPVPQIYGIVASHTLIVIVAYRPDTPDNEVRTVAHFDMKEKDHDVWNAFALAITVCHLRNVQMRLAEETGLAAKGPDWMEPVVEDPDL